MNDESKSRRERINNEREEVTSLETDLATMDEEVKITFVRWSIFSFKAICWRFFFSSSPSICGLEEEKKGSGEKIQSVIVSRGRLKSELALFFSSRSFSNSSELSFEVPFTSASSRN